MNEDSDSEKQLKSALRPVVPPEGFAERVMLRIEQAPERSRVSHLPKWFAAIAASLLLGVIVLHQWQMSRQAQGLEARRQLIEALRVTGEKLDVAYQIVNSETHTQPGESAGA
jgi:negative regulator of sigma E activity